MGAAYCAFTGDERALLRSILRYCSNHAATLNPGPHKKTHFVLFKLIRGGNNSVKHLN